MPKVSEMTRTLKRLKPRFIPPSKSDGMVRAGRRRCDHISPEFYSKAAKLRLTVNREGTPGRSEEGGIGSAPCWLVCSSTQKKLG